MPPVTIAMVSCLHRSPRSSSPMPCSRAGLIRCSPRRVRRGLEISRFEVQGWMGEISVGDRTYRVVATGRDGNWTAHAERIDTGDSFGIECAGETEAAATARLVDWLTWQHEHVAALEALQQA